MYIHIEKVKQKKHCTATDKLSTSVQPDFTDRNPEAQRPSAGDSQRPDQAPFPHQTRHHE